MNFHNLIRLSEKKENNLKTRKEELVLIYFYRDYNTDKPGNIYFQSNKYIVKCNFS